MTNEWVKKRQYIYTMKYYYSAIQKKEIVRHQWLTPVILATQEAEIWRFEASPGK
jgi:hypothetical protein